MEDANDNPIILRDHLVGRTSSNISFKYIIASMVKLMFYLSANDRTHRCGVSFAASCGVIGYVLFCYCFYYGYVFFYPLIYYRCNLDAFFL